MDSEFWIKRIGDLEAEARVNEAAVADAKAALFNDIALAKEAKPAVRKALEDAELALADTLGALEVARKHLHATKAAEEHDRRMAHADELRRHDAARRKALAAFEKSLATALKHLAASEQIALEMRGYGDTTMRGHLNERARPIASWVAARWTETIGHGVDPLIKALSDRKSTAAWVEGKSLNDLIGDPAGDYLKRAEAPRDRAA
jgi:hypothetical protein